LASLELLLLVYLELKVVKQAADHHLVQHEEKKTQHFTSIL
jgi:hypothetical protein